jgi:hypothetical protein
MGEKRRQLLARDRRDARELRRERRDALRLNRRLVHARGVVVARLGAIGGAAGRFEDAPQHGEVAILQFLDAAKRSLVGLQWMAGHPPTAGELIKVGAGIGAAIQRPELDAGCSGRWGRWGR